MGRRARDPFLSATREAATGRGGQAEAVLGFRRPALAARLKSCHAIVTVRVPPDRKGADEQIAEHQDSGTPVREMMAVMDNTAVALSLARGRIAFGTAALLTPRLAARAMGAGRTPTATTRLLARMVGGRDIALGLGTVIALDRGKPVRGWLEGSALADAVDCLACLPVRTELPANVVRATVSLAGASAIVGILLSRRLDPPPPAHPGQPEAIATGHTDEP